MLRCKLPKSIVFMNDFKKINNITGWLVFLLVAVIYTIAIEPTASLWDCGEFIAVSYKLEVPHPPGAPLFLLIGRMFSFFASDVENVAFWINMSSAMSSAFTVLFLFWSIVLLARKILKITPGEETKEQTFTMMGAGIVGALAYAFSDSFWFSAEEAEVYAMSSFFTAFVFWAILKWELIENSSTANKWLILIAYMMGLSIGVHLLNLLTIPSLGLIYYFKNYKPTSKGFILTIAISGFIILLVQYGVIIGLPTLAGFFEVMFVNSLGLPFGSGVVFFGIVFLALIILGIYYTQKQQKEILNIAFLSIAFIVIGYTSYGVIVIRANYDPLINENNPDDAISVVQYLKREQYGDWPVGYGPYFTAELKDQKQGAAVYVKGEDKYEVSRHKIENVYEKADMTIFPRIHSSRADHVRGYRQVLNLKPGEKPNFGDNLSFLFKQQFGHFYWRYFLWNFVGRQSDIQNAGVLWPWDAVEEVPELLANNNARNNYWMLPLILGIIGLIFTYGRNRKVFSVVMVLFVMTGLAIILYLNPPPTEPRERDYAYAASFYAFAIFIGFSVIPIAEFFGNLLKSNAKGAIAATIVCLAAPAIMFAEGWDDHNRADRYFSVDGAKNILNATAENAILFTGGDNDTFPLWYSQEVEGFRDDVRVIVLTYFNTDWYLNQMRRQAYNSEPLPFSFEEKHYKQGTNDYLPVYENPNLNSETISLPQFLKLVKDDHPAIKIAAQSGSKITYVPSKTFYLNIDVAHVTGLKIVPNDMTVINKMVIPIKGSHLEKKDLMILDLIVANNWERPIYFNNTSLMGTNLDFSDYVVQEGSTFRLLPVHNPRKDSKLVNADLMYDNIMNKSFWRGLDNPDIYYNTEDYIQRSITPFRMQFNTLAAALYNKQDKERAREVMLKSLEVITDEAVPYDYSSIETVEILTRLGEKEKAMEIAKTVARRSAEFLEYYLRNDDVFVDGRDLQINAVMLNGMTQALAKEGETELLPKYRKVLEHFQSGGR